MSSEESRAPVARRCKFTCDGIEFFSNTDRSAGSLRNSTGLRAYVGQTRSTGCYATPEKRGEEQGRWANRMRHRDSHHWQTAVIGRGADMAAKNGYARFAQQVERVGLLGFSLSRTLSHEDNDTAVRCGCVCRADYRTSRRRHRATTTPRPLFWSHHLPFDGQPGASGSLIPSKTIADTETGEGTGAWSRDSYPRMNTWSSCS